MVKKNNLRAWGVGISAMVIAAVSTLPVMVLPIFVVPLSENLNSTIGNISLVISLVSLGAILSLLLFGKITSKVPLKLLAIIGGLVILGFLLIMGVTTSILPLYIAAFCMGFFGVFAGGPMAQIVISQWFIKARGTLISLIMVIASALGAAIVSVFANLLQTFTYGQIVIWFGVIIALVVIVLALLFIGGTPESKGLKPYGFEEAPSDGGGQESAVSMSGGVNLSLSQIYKIPVFWFVILIPILATIAITSFGSQAANFNMSIGLSEVDSGYALSIRMIAGMVWSLLFGVISDKKNPSVAMFVTSIAAAVICFTIFLWQGWVGAIICAISFSGANCMAIFGPITLPKLFGMKEAGSMIGFANAASGIGAFIGPAVAGFLFDVNKNYNFIYTIMGVLVIICIVIGFWVGSKKNAETIRLKAES